MNREIILILALNGIIMTLAVSILIEQKQINMLTDDFVLQNKNNEEFAKQITILQAEVNLLQSGNQSQGHYKGEGIYVLPNGHVVSCIEEKCIIDPVIEVKENLTTISDYGRMHILAEQNRMSQ